MPEKLNTGPELRERLWQLLTQERPTLGMIFEKLLPSLLTLAIALLATAAIISRAGEGWLTLAGLGLVAAFFYVMTVLIWRTPKASVWLSVVLMPWLFVIALALMGAEKLFELLGNRRGRDRHNTGTVLNLSQKQPNRRKRT